MANTTVNLDTLKQIGEGIFPPQKMRKPVENQMDQQQDALMTLMQLAYPELLTETYQRPKATFASQMMQPLPAGQIPTAQQPTALQGNAGGSPMQAQQFDPAINTPQRTTGAFGFPLVPTQFGQQGNDIAQRGFGLSNDKPQTAPTPAGAEQAQRQMKDYIEPYMQMFGDAVPKERGIDKEHQKYLMMTGLANSLGRALKSIGDVAGAYKGAPVTPFEDPYSGQIMQNMNQLYNQAYQDAQRKDQMSFQAMLNAIKSGSSDYRYDDQKDFQRSEREERQGFSAEERKARQDFTAEELARRQGFADTQRVKGEEFKREQDKLDKKYRTDYQRQGHLDNLDEIRERAKYYKTGGTTKIKQEDSTWGLYAVNSNGQRVYVDDGTAYKFLQDYVSEPAYGSFHDNVNDLVNDKAAMQEALSMFQKIWDVKGDDTFIVKTKMNAKTNAPTEESKTNQPTDNQVSQWNWINKHFRSGKPYDKKHMSEFILEMSQKYGMSEGDAYDYYVESKDWFNSQNKK